MKLRRPIADFATSLLIAQGMTTATEIGQRRVATEPSTTHVLAAFDTLAAAATSDAERLELAVQKLAFTKANGVR
jgi:hypothetical protein